MSLLEQHRCEEIIGDGTLVLDVGASVGDFALEARRAGGRVWCVEPFAPNIAALHRQGLTVIAAAAGSDDGWGELSEPADPVVRTTGCFLGAVSAMPTPGAVRVAGLASLLDATTMPAIDVMKVDIEGGEYALFGGAAPSTLRRIGFVTIECHAWTSPGQPRSVALGERDGAPYEPGSMATLLDRLSETHAMCIDGSTEDGCVMWGALR